MQFMAPVRRERTIAVADVMSGGASVAILALPALDDARVIASAHTLMVPERADPVHAALAVGSQVEEVSDKALKSLGAARPQIERVHLTMHTPWILSQSIRTMQRFSDERRIDHALVGAVARDALSAESPSKQRPYEAAVTRIWLNGYPVRHVEGKYAHSVAVASLISNADERVERTVIASLEKAFPAASVTRHSGLLSALKASGRAAGEDYVIVSVGIESTHLAVVHDGMITQQCSVPEGIRTMLSRFAPERAPEETLGSMRMLEREACADAACEALKSSVAAAEPDLARVFGETIAKIASEQRLPNTLVLFVQNDFAEWLSRFFARIDFSQFTVTTLPFDVAIMRSPDFSSKLSSADKLEPSLAAACIAALSQEND
ncbi:MAG TPA: hypothetical protein VJL39_02230 [Candidatus Paceibacterota bacterium]